jgi:hypothetical protein
VTEEAKKPKVHHFDDLPQALREHRSRIRAMMLTRCAEPGSPIPPQMATRAADWITMLTVVRANRRRSHGREPFPDLETLKNDIAASAEQVEILFLAAIEDVDDETPIAVAPGVRRSLRARELGAPREMAGDTAVGAPGDDPERGVSRSESEGSADHDGEPQAPGLPERGA